MKRIIKSFALLIALLTCTVALCSCSLIYDIFGDILIVDHKESPIYYFTSATEDDLRADLQVNYGPHFFDRFSIVREISNYEISCIFEEGIQTVEVKKNSRTYRYEILMVDESKLSVEGDFVFCEIKGNEYLLEYRGNETDLTLPERDKNYIIYEDVFAYDKELDKGHKLNSVVIGNSVTHISTDAFHGSPIKSVDIGENVSNICSGAFTLCTELERVNVPSVEKWLQVKFGTMTPLRLKEGMFETIIGGSVTFTPDISTGNVIYFVGATEIVGTHVVLFDSEIKDGYIYCYDSEGNVVMTMVYPVANPVYFAGSVYINGAKIEELEIPSSIVTVSTAFAGSDIKSVKIHKDVHNVSTGAFSDCDQLEKIELEDIDPFVCNSIGKAFDEDCKAFNEYEGAYYIGNDANPYMVLVAAKEIEYHSLTTHADTKVIASGAFEKVEKCHQIILSDSVMYIGSNIGLKKVGETNIISGAGLRYVGRQTYTGSSEVNGVMNLKCDDPSEWYYTDNDGTKYHFVHSGDINLFDLIHDIYRDLPANNQ